MIIVSMISCLNLKMMVEFIFLNYIVLGQYHLLRDLLNKKTALLVTIIGLYLLFKKIYRHYFAKIEVKKFYDVVINNQKIKAYLDTGNEVNYHGIAVCFTNDIRLLEKFYKTISIATANGITKIDLYICSCFEINAKIKTIYLAYLDTPYKMIVGLDIFLGG